MKASAKALTAIILAAGEGTRMKSRLPKVLQPLAGQSLLGRVMATLSAAGAEKQVVVLGHGAPQVAATLPADVAWVIQRQRLGTGHAVRMAEAVMKKNTGDVLVVCGDAPLIQAGTIRQLYRVHKTLKAAATVLTAQVDSPRGYGRIVRDLKNPRLISRIVEERDADAGEKCINEINSGAYCFQMPLLFEMIRRVTNRNQKGEYYLTDVVELLRRAGKPVAAFCAPDAQEVLGVNTRQELVQAGRIVNRRKVNELLDSGVTIWDPEHTWIESTVKVGVDTEIFPGTVLTGNTFIGEGNRIGPDTRIRDSRIGRGTRIMDSMIEQAWIGDDVRIGPYSHIRPGTRIEAKVHIGNFAEINRSRLHSGVKMGHVSYLGDATVGSRTNIGAGTITANFDGAKKHPTIIGEDAFIGSGSILVAPNTIGRRALTGAGAVLKAGTSVPPEMVVVGVPARVIKRRKLDSAATGRTERKAKAKR